MSKNVTEVSDKEFVELWIDAYRRQIGLIGLVDEQGWVYVRASGRASSLRLAGVKLPTMRTSKQKNNGLTTDVKSLNDMIIEELGVEALDWRNR